MPPPDASRQDATPRRHPPGPRGRLVLGSLGQARVDPIQLFMDGVRDHGDLVRYRMGPYHAYVVRHPDHIKYVLQENHQNFDKQTRGFAQLRLLLGNGLLTSEGDFWLRQRRIAQPSFHRQRIAGFAAAITRAANDRIDLWLDSARAGAALDVAQEMAQLTLRIVGETLLSTDVSTAASDVGQSLTTLLALFNDRVTSVLNLPLGIPTAANRRANAAIGKLDDLVMGIVRQRRASGRDAGDMLSMLMDARDEETGEGMTDRQLRDEVMTIFLAGHETVSNALTWTFYLLSKSPPVFRQLRAELQRVLAGRDPGHQDLAQLTFTECVVKESMRLYPPAWVIARRTVADDQLGGFFIAANSFVFVCPYVTHRHPEFWPNPEGFDPERFAGGRTALLPRFAYFPFGGGPRLCIGNNFAMMEAILLVATIAQRVRLDLVANHPVEPEPIVTLRPRYGMRMTAHRLD